MCAHKPRMDVTCPARSDLTTKREAATDRTPRDCRFFLMNTPPSLRNFKKRGAERDQSPRAWNERPQIFPDAPFPKEELHSRARRKLYARLVRRCLYLFPLFRTCSQKSSRLKGRRRKIASRALSKPHYFRLKTVRDMVERIQRRRFCVASTAPSHQCTFFILLLPEISALSESSRTRPAIRPNSRAVSSPSVTSKTKTFLYIVFAGCSKRSERRGARRIDERRRT